MNAARLVFRRAVRAKVKARIGLVGPSGAGKSLTALLIARGLVGPEGRIAGIDSERGSLSLYASEVEFDCLDLPDHSPHTYVMAINAAVDAGYDAIVIDSLSHAWTGKEGALEQVDTAAKRSKSGNTFAAWRDVTPGHNHMIDTIVGADAHMICTLRAKTEYILEDNGRGKQTPRKVGMAPIQRDGMEYEFDLVAELDLDHNLIVSKTRYIDLGLDQRVIARPGIELGSSIRQYLMAGADVEVTGRQAPRQQPPQQPQPQQRREPEHRRSEHQPQQQERQQPQPQQTTQTTQQRSTPTDPLKAIDAADAYWAKTFGNSLPAWLQQLWTQCVDWARSEPSADSVGALRWIASGVNNNEAPDVIWNGAPLRKVRQRAAFVQRVQAPSNKVSVWAQAIMLHAHDDAAGIEGAVSRLTRNACEGYISELVGLNVEDRGQWVRTVLRSGWPHEAGLRDGQGAGPELETATNEELSGPWDQEGA